MEIQKRIDLHEDRQTLYLTVANCRLSKMKNKKWPYTMKADWKSPQLREPGGSSRRLQWKKSMCIFYVVVVAVVVVVVVAVDDDDAVDDADYDADDDVDEGEGEGEKEDERGGHSQRKI